MDAQINGHDVLIYFNIGASIAGFFMLYLKHDRRISRLETEVKTRLSSIETHLFHIMRSLKMSPREPLKENESHD